MKLALFFFSLLFPSLYGLAESEAPVTEITIFNRLEFEHPERLPIILDDVGYIDSADSELVKKFENAVLLTGLGPNQKKEMTHSEWILSLRQMVSSEEKKKWAFYAPNKTMILSSSNKWPQGRISSQIIRRLQGQCRECEVKVIDLKFSREPTFVYDQIDIDYQSLRLQPIQSIGVTIREYQGVRTETAIANLTLAISRPTVIAVKEIPVGQKLGSENYRIELRSIQLLNSIEPSEVQHKVARRPIRAGQAILISDVTEQTLVKRGDLIQVIVGNESFEISKKMQAQDSGSKGARIRLKSLDDKGAANMTGTVIDENTVRIE